MAETRLNVQFTLTVDNGKQFGCKIRLKAYAY